MSVIAITRIQHGKPDGTVVNIGVGQTVTGLSDDEVKSLVIGGSAIETGKNRKYSAAPVAGTRDDETLQRDALIVKVASETGDDDEATTNISDPAAKARAAAQGAPAAPGGPGAANPQGNVK